MYSKNLSGAGSCSVGATCRRRAKDSRGLPSLRSAGPIRSLCGSEDLGRRSPLRRVQSHHSRGPEFESLERSSGATKGHHSSLSCRNSKTERPCAFPLGAAAPLCKTVGIRAKSLSHCSSGLHYHVRPFAVASAPQKSRRSSGLRATGYPLSPLSLRGSTEFGTLCPTSCSASGHPAKASRVAGSLGFCTESC